MGQVGKKSALQIEIERQRLNSRKGGSMICYHLSKRKPGKGLIISHDPTLKTYEEGVAQKYPLKEVPSW